MEGAPAFAGLNQINAVIPLDVTGGPDAPATISAGNAFTDIVDVPIGLRGRSIGPPAVC